MWVSIVLHFDDNTNSFFGRFITNITNTDDGAFCHQFSNMHKHIRFLHLIGNLMYDDTLSARIIDDFATRSYMESAFSCCVHVNDAINSVNGCTRWKIWTFDMFHVFLDGNIWPSRIFFTLFKYTLYVKFYCTCNFSQVVWRNSCRHTNSNTIRSIEEKIGESSRQNGWFHLRIVKIRLEVDRFLFNVFKHVFGDAIQSTLCISHCCRRIAID